MESDLFRVNPQEQDSTSLVCRICYSSEVAISKLIYPCKCSGSIRYVHEECLKTWLLATNQKIKKKTCELCHTPYQIEMETKQYISCDGLCKEKFAGSIFAGILIGILGLIVILLVFLVGKYQISDSSSQNYLLAIIIGCGLAGLIILLLLACIIKGLLFQSEIQIFSIKNYEPALELHEKLGVQLNNNILPTEFNEVCHYSMPRFVKSKERKTCTPKVVPLCQTPVFDGNRLVGYKKDLFNDKISNSCTAQRTDIEKLSLICNNSI